MVSVCQAINRLCRKKYRVDKYSDYVYLRRLQPTDQHWTVTTRVVLSVVSHSDIPLVAKMSHFSSKMNRKLIVNELFTQNKYLILLHFICFSIQSLGRSLQFYQKRLFEMRTLGKMPPSAWVGGGQGLYMHVHLHRLGKLTVNYNRNCTNMYIQAHTNKCCIYVTSVV